MTGTLVIQNVLYQWALSRVAGIHAFPGRYRGVYLTLVVTLLALHVIAAMVKVSLITGLVLAAIASLLVFWVNRDRMDIQRTFPEILRVPFMRQLLGATVR